MTYEADVQLNKKNQTKPIQPFILRRMLTIQILHLFILTHNGFINGNICKVLDEIQ